jgi:hypothetical protein
VHGIATVTRWLASAPPGRLTLISEPSAEGMRHRIFVMVAIAMSRVRTVRLQARREVVEAVRQHAPRDTDRTAPRPRHEETGELMFIDGGSPFDLVDPAATPAHVVAVAPLGISQRRLRSLALDYRSGGLVGVILVQRRLRRGRTSAVDSPRARAPRTRDVPAPEPEPA